MIEYAEFIAAFDQKLFPHTKLLYKHTQKAGTSYQRNIGAHLVSADIFHFVDDDTILEPTYIEKMDAIFESNTHYAGGMGCVINVLPKINNMHRWLRVLFLLQRDHDSGNFTFSGMPTHAYGTTTFKDVQVLGGCCMSYRRDIFLHYLFDEQLGQYAYLEDVDCSWRVSQNHRLFYNPTAKLKHIKSPVNRAKVAERKALFLRNYRYLFFKNVYPHNKFKIFAHWWSVLGLFFCSFVARDVESLKGYWQGLGAYYTKVSGQNTQRMKKT